MTNDGNSLCHEKMEWACCMALSRSMLPSLQELTAFEAAGRHKNFTTAAVELSLTQSAISKQIKNLENTLGVFLFHRSKGRVELTPQGERYLLSVRRILYEYETETHSIIASAGSETTLRIASIPTLAAKWLIPNLTEFMNSNPSITVELTTALNPFDFNENPVDVALHYGSSIWPDSELIYMCHDEIVAIGSPNYMKKNNIKNIKDINNTVLLQQSTRPHMWQEWAEKLGHQLPNPYRGPIFDQFSMTIQAAIAGMGVALVPTFLIQEELLSGQLVALYEPPQFSNGAYYIVVPFRSRHNPAIKPFIEWVVSLTRPHSRQPNLALSKEHDTRTFINPYGS